MSHIIVCSVSEFQKGKRAEEEEEEGSWKWSWESEAAAGDWREGIRHQNQTGLYFLYSNTYNHVFADS